MSECSQETAVVPTDTACSSRSFWLKGGHRVYSLYLAAHAFLSGRAFIRVVWALVAVLDSWLFAEGVEESGAGFPKSVIAFLILLTSGFWITLRPKVRIGQRFAHELLLDSALGYFSFATVSAMVGQAFSIRHHTSIPNRWDLLVWLLDEGPINLRFCLVLVFAVTRTSAWLIENMVEETLQPEEE